MNRKKAGVFHEKLASGKTMSAIIGTINVTKRIRQNPIWQRKDYGWAWIDLCLIANDDDREVFVNGQRVRIRRGQVLRSLRSLEAEWEVSGEWLDRFLHFCRDEGMIRVEKKTNRYTIITILNYEAYNPKTTVTETVSETVTEPGTETTTETVTEPGTETERNKEVGSGKWKGEAPLPERNLPSNEEVEAFCSMFAGIPALGIPPGVPEGWWTGWLAERLRNPSRFPADWQRDLVLKLRQDFVNRHPKLRSLNGAWVVGEVFGKNGGEKAGGKTVAQQMFELDRAIKEKRLQSAGFEDTQPELAERLDREADELEKQRQALE